MRVHIAVVNEPYTVGEAQGWYTDCTSQVAISVSPDYPLAPSKVMRDDGFVVVEIGGVAHYSCYFSPNWSIEEFIAYLTCRRGKVVVISDFNAKSEE